MAVMVGGIALSASPSWADQYGSKEAAAKAGDASAVAKSISLPDRFTYGGGQITPDQAEREALVCNQDANSVRCFDTLAQANKDLGVPTASAASARGRAKARRAAATPCDQLNALQLFQYAQSTPCLYTGNGWLLQLQGRQSWYNMGSYSNSASAYYMGDHSGHMSDYNDGGGYWVPYATGVGDYKLSLNGTSWSNRIDSRYRN